MTTPQQLSKHFKDVFFGGNWTAVNLKDTIEGITWQQATTKVHNLNTIAVLVFHINYYIDAVLKVLQGEPLKASDKYSFGLEPITSEEEWQHLLDKTFTQAELFAARMEALEEKKLFEDFADPQYGNYFRNLAGIVEHTHYHLGQISLLKKILYEPQNQ